MTTEEFAGFLLRMSGSTYMSSCLYYACMSEYMYELMLCQNQQLTRNVICRDKDVAFVQ